MQKHKTDDLLFYTELIVVTATVIILAQLWKDFIVRIIGNASIGSFLFINIAITIVCILILSYFFKNDYIISQQKVIDIHDVLLKRKKEMLN